MVRNASIVDAEISSIVLGWLNPSANQSISCLKRAGFSLRGISFAEGFISVYVQTKHLTAIAVIAVAPTSKASFVYSCMQTRLMGQFNGK